MQNDFQNLFNRAKNITLSSGEKREIRGNLLLLIKANPVRNSDSLRLLLEEGSKSSAFAGLFGLKSLLTNLKPMTIALIIALLLGGGTSFAAENALPGGVLYPVKVGINEEVGSWIAVSSEAQAKWDAHLAERRLEEAEKLAAKGNLNAEARADLAARFENHTEAFEKDVEKMDGKNDTRGSFEAHSDFEASLRAHERVLAEMGKEKEGAQSDVASILAKVRVRLNTVAQARTDDEVKVSAGANAEFKTAAEGKLKAAENKIEETRNFIEKVKASVGASVAAEAEAKLKVAENIVVRGKAEMEAKTYALAFASFEEAMRGAKEAKLVIVAQEKDNLHVILPGADVRSDSESSFEESEKGDKNENENDEQNGFFGESVEAESETDAHSDIGDTKADTNTGVKGTVKVNVGW